MKKIIIFLFLASIFVLSFLPIKDTDFGWHYRCGEDFLKNGVLCTKNNFSYFLPNYKASNPSFIYDISLAWVFDHFNFIGVSALGGLIMTLAAFFYLKLLKNSLFYKIVSFYLIFFLSSTVFNLGLRSQIISYLFFLITLFIIGASSKNKNLLFFLPFLFFIWVNSHIGFFLGPIVLIISQIKKQKNYLFSVLIITLSLGATLVNPFGIKVFGEIYNHLRSPLNQMIAEWVAPAFFQIIFILLLTIIEIVQFIRNKNFSIYNWLLLIFFSLLAATGRRNLPFFYTVFFYLFAKNFKFNPEIIDSLYLAILSAFSLFLLMIIIPATIKFDTNWDIYCNQNASSVPCGAAKNYSQLSGNVYNEYEWGGFLIWQRPDIKVFVDGRMPAWRDENGDSPYKVFLNIIQTKPGWNEKLASLHTDYILIAKGTFLDLLLEKNPKDYGWEEKYRDSVAVIYKKI